MQRIVLLACIALTLAGPLPPAFAQGNGGSQSSCGLHYSSCKQTARADHQFCLQSSGKNCAATFNKAMQRCSNAHSRCNGTY